jgi:hypothetical protein
MVNLLTNVQAMLPFLERLHEPMHLEEISRQLGSPHATVRLWLNRLVEKGVLRRSNRGRLTEYSLNRDSPIILHYLVVAEKLRLINACERDLVLKEFVHRMEAEPGILLIFGSAAVNSGDANDYDILMIGKHDTHGMTEQAKRLDKEAHIISVARLDKISKTLKHEIMKKHLIVNGSEEVLIWLLSNGA